MPPHLGAHIGHFDNVAEASRLKSKYWHARASTNQAPNPYVDGTT